MAKAGAPIIGINCLFDPFIALETISKMKVRFNKQMAEASVFEGEIS